MNSQETLVLAGQYSFPFDKNRLNVCAIDLIIFFGKMKKLDQYTCMLYKIEDNRFHIFVMVERKQALLRMNIGNDIPYELDFLVE
jgi:hypothetical protein